MAEPKTASAPVPPDDGTGRDRPRKDRRQGVSPSAELPAGADPLLDVNQAAALLGVQPATLYQWAYQRRVPTVKLFGRALRFRLSVIQQLMKSFDRPALRESVDDE